MGTIQLMNTARYKALITDIDGTVAPISTDSHTAPCIVEGGTRIVAPDTGNTIWEQALDPGAPAQILAILKHEATSGKLMTSDDNKLLELTETGTVPDHLELAIRIAGEVTGRGLGSGHLTPSWFGHDMVDLHITHREATKVHAIKEWQQFEDVIN